MSGWTSGGRLSARGHSWILDRAEAGADCEALHLVREASPGAKITLLSPFDRFAALHERRTARVVSPRRCYHVIRQIAASCDPAGALKSLASARIDLLPHQLEPALAVFAHGATRMLIADGVGLGKTVQAGLIAAECLRRSPSARSLILVPAGLRDQWKGELDHLFGLECISADAAWLKAAASDRPSGANPWALPGTYLASIDFVKQPEALRPLEDVGWDLCVLDEAHTASARSDRRVAAHAVACRSRVVVLLTATPRTDDPAEHEALCGIGRIDPHEGPVLLFRRSQRDIGGRADRRSTLLVVRPSEAELRMHELLEEYTRRVWREAATRGDELATLAATVLRKRALSGAGSLAASVKRRIDLLVAPPPALDEQLRLPMWEEDPLEDDEPLTALAAPGLANAASERRWLGLIAEAAQRAAVMESKTRFMRRLLRRIGEPVIVFTEYRDTLNRLKHALSDARRSVLLLHGGMRPAERSRVQHEFNDTSADCRADSPVLIATDAAAEGLNLHLRCRLVIHYELPWSTARLEQRAGRVDRLGQRRRVHEAGLIAATTAERLVLAPLMRRVARSRSAGHEAEGLPEALAESHVAELIMGSGATNAGRDSSSATAPPATSSYSVELTHAASAEAARVAAKRRLSPAAPSNDRTHRHDGPVASLIRLRSSGLNPGYVAVHVLRLSNRRGEIVHEEPIVWQVSSPLNGRKRSDEEIRAAALELLARSSVEREKLIALRIGTALARSVIIHQSVETAWARRTRLILESLRIHSTQLVQHGLFDKRRRVQPAALQAETPLTEAEESTHTGALMSVDVRLAAILVVLQR